MTIYQIKKIQENSKEEIQNLIHNLPIEVQNHIYAKKDPSSFLESALAYITLFDMLESSLGISKKPHIRFEGKPKFLDLNYHFNISHCDSYIACVISTNEVGIDIERIRPFEEKFARYISNEKEFHYIMQNENPSLEVLKLWTKKESYLKCKGIGIQIGDTLKNCLDSTFESNFKTELVEDSKYCLTVYEELTS